MGRRLLAGAGMTSIRFTLTGNHTVITSYWPDTVQSDSLYDVVVTTADPIAEMRQIRERLALIISTVQVVTQPFEIILVDESKLLSDAVKSTMTTTRITSDTSSPQPYNTALVEVTGTPTGTPTTTPKPQLVARPVPYPVTPPENTSIIVIALAILKLS